jgi:predicted secreted protein
MQWTSILAIYFLFFVFSAFVLLPFGVRTHDEAGVEKIPGQADSAPVEFRAGKLVLRALIVSAVVTTVYVLNYINGWITVDDLILWGPSAE